MNSDNPWSDNRTPKDFILSRKPVTELTQSTIEKMVSDSENAIRRKDVNGVMSLIALDFTYLGPELTNGEIKMVPGNRDRFQIALCGSFEASNCDNYSMKVSSVEIMSPESAKVTLVVSNPGDSQFSNLYGSEVRETILIELYLGRPVISRLEIENPA